MSKTNVKEKNNRLISFKGIDISIIFISMFLSAFCLVFVYSASAFESSEAKSFLNLISLTSSDKLLMKTILFIVAGVIMMIAISAVDVKSLKNRFPKIYKLITNPAIYYSISVCLFLFLEVMKKIGLKYEKDGSSEAGLGFLIKANNAYRWIKIPHTPISFQPSEVVKLLLIIAFALMIVNAGVILKHKRGILIFIAFAALPSFLVLVCSSDLSSSIVVFGIMYIMMFVAGPDLKNSLIILFAMLALVFAVGGALVLYNYGKDEVDIKPYQAKRILAWLYPDMYPKSADQTKQAMYAIGSGGLTGVGIGNSMQKIKKLPEAQNDMIFALICEELGLFGGILVLLLYGVLIFRMYMIVLNTDNLFDRMVVVGVISHIGLQVIINVFVVTKLFPNTGIPLPLISAGGSSIVLMYMELGLVLNIGKSIERK